MTEKTQNTALEVFPLLPLRDIVVFPRMVITLFMGRAKSIRAAEIAMNQGKKILLVAQRDGQIDEPTGQERPSPTGTHRISPTSSLPAAIAGFAFISARTLMPNLRAIR